MNLTDVLEVLLGLAILVVIAFCLSWKWCDYNGAGRKNDHKVPWVDKNGNLRYEVFAERKT